MSLTTKEKPDDLIYEPLPQGRFIRCLKLHPGSNNAPLECDLETVNLDDKPRYEAISYVWGSDVKSVAILCNGKTTHITENLCEALQRIRSPSELRTLWADSICIDQGADVEKGHQVALMGPVYAKARRVLIYLAGDDEGHSSTLASLLAESDTRVRQGLSEIAGIEDAKFSYLSPEEMAAFALDLRWRSLGVILEQPWFSRGWVVQEAALAQHAIVLWGCGSFDMESLMRCIIWLNSRCGPVFHNLCAEFVGFGDVNIHFNFHMLRHKPEARAYDFNLSTLGLTDILALAMSLSTKDPRDKIFAFQALAGYGQSDSAAQILPWTPGLMQPDYTKSTEDVYTEFASKQILSGNIRILHCSEQVDSGDLDATSAMPTWVARWDRGTVHVGPTVFTMQKLLPSSSYRSQLTREIKGAALTVTGVIFDHVCHHANVLLSGEQEVGPAIEIVRLWQSIHRKNLAQAYRSDVRPAAMISCLCEGCCTIDVEWTTWAQEQENFADFLTTMGQPYSTETGGSRFPNILRFIRRYSGNRSLVGTSRGLLGLAPRAVADGDVCCIIFGCDTPVILRLVPGRSAGEEPHYRLVGSAWIAGIEVGPAEGGGIFVPMFGSEESKDWVGWGLKEHDITII